MANEQNLKPFKKGFDERREGNGRKSWPDLKEAIEKNGDLDDVLKALYKQAQKGNVKAIQEIFDRYYGKSGQKIELGNIAGSEGLKIVVESTDMAEKIKKVLE